MRSEATAALNYLCVHEIFLIVILVTVKFGDRGLLKRGSAVVKRSRVQVFPCIFLPTTFARPRRRMLFGTRVTGVAGRCDS